MLSDDTRPSIDLSSFSDAASASSLAWHRLPSFCYSDVDLKSDNMLSGAICGSSAACRNHC
jgi:hypothetical protein